MEERHTSKDGELSLAAKVESLLFVADGPVSVGRLAEALETTPGQIEQAMADLEGATTGGGLRLQRAGSRVQLITAPEAAPCIERFLGLEARTRLSRAALETLAIIAYRQPMTRPEIEAIRGVNSDSVLRTLLSVGLIEDVGRAPTVGRPILYGTTFEFLQHFGLRSMDELPPLDRAAGEEGDSSAAEEHAPSPGEDSVPSAAEEGAPVLSEEGGSSAAEEHAPSPGEEGGSTEDA